MRRTVVLVAAVGGSLLYAARRRRGRERVQLHFDDGSTVTLEQGSAAADELLALARGIL
jgi:hypothetical protein